MLFFANVMKIILIGGGSFMNKIFSKKMLAFLLSVHMVVTSVPLVAIAATGDTGTLNPVTSLICNDSSRPHTRSNLAILNDGDSKNTSERHGGGGSG